MDVTVRCAYPYYPEWKDKSGRNGLKIERYMVGELMVERHGLFIPTNPQSIAQRLLYELSFFISLCRSSLRGGRFDAVIVFCPLAGSVAYGALHKFLSGTPLLLNIQDLPADAAAAGGVARGRILKGLLRFVQETLFNRADVWRSISPIMIDQLKGLRRRDQPLRFIPDWLHPTMSEAIGSHPSKVGRPVGRPARLLYSGNIGAKQGLLDFCKVLQRSEAPFVFQINGDGGGAAQVRDWVASMDDSRFRVGPLVDEAAFVKALHDADLFVITEKPDKRASFFPSKTIPAMSTATPILAVSNPDSPLGSEVRHHAIGPWFSWDRCSEVGPMLAEIGDYPGQFEEWQRNGHIRSRAFDREHCLDQFEQAIRDLVLNQISGSTSAGLARPVVSVEST